MRLRPARTALSARYITFRLGTSGHRMRSPSGRNRSAPGGLEWEVVESVPVSENIKTQTGPWREHIANWQETLRRLSVAGIRTVCYNFMPVLDWTRTDLRWTTRHGAKAMRFDRIDFVAFDLHLLQRPGAFEDYDEATREMAAQPLPRDDGRATAGPVAQHRRGPSGLRRGLQPAAAQGASGDLCRDQPRKAAAPSRRFSRRGDAGGGAGRDQYLRPSGRSAMGAARIAAHPVECRGLCPHAARGRQPGEWRDLLHGFARRPRGQRPAGHGSRVRAPHPLRPSTQRPPRGAADTLLVLRGRTSGRRYRHGGRYRRTRSPRKSGGVPRAGRTTRSPCDRIMARRSWTISRAVPSPATRPSAA